MNAKKAKALRLIARQLQAVTEGSKEWNDVQTREISRSPEKIYADMEAQGMTPEQVMGAVRYNGQSTFLTSRIRMHNPDSGRGIYKAMKKRELA